jgi:hypothetical protein
LSRQSRSEPYWFRPQYQVDDDAPAEFKLKPLGMVTMLDVTSETKGVKFTGEAYRIALTASVLDWRNVSIGDEKVDFSAAALDEIMATPTPEFMVWARQIFLEAMGKARPTEALRKNS